jgi:hypothetical protein
MPDRNDDRFLNDLLDASLRQYCAGPPREGLEGRALAALRAAAAPRPRRLWVWAWAAGLGVVTVMVFTLVRHSQPPATPRGAVSAKGNPLGTIPSAATKAPAESGASVAKVKLARRQHTTRSARPKRPEQFPTPRPLSEQERLLLVYVQAISPDAVKEKSATEQSAQPDIPLLTITALKIKPLGDEHEMQEE